VKLNFEAMFAGVSAAGKAGQAGQTGQAGKNGQIGQAGQAASEFSALLDAIRAGKVAHKFSEAMPQVAPEAEGDATPHQTAPQAAGEIRARLGAAKRGHAPTQTPSENLQSGPALAQAAPRTSEGHPAPTQTPFSPLRTDLRPPHPSIGPVESDLALTQTLVEDVQSSPAPTQTADLALERHPAPTQTPFSPLRTDLRPPHPPIGPVESDLALTQTPVEDVQSSPAPTQTADLALEGHPAPTQAPTPDVDSDLALAQTADAPGPAPHTADPDQFSDALKNLPIPPEATPQQPAAAPVDAADVQVVAEPAETPREPLPAQKETFLRVSDRQLQWPKTEQKARPDAMPLANVAGEVEAEQQLSKPQPSKPQASKQAAETREDAMQTAETQQTKPNTEKTSAAAQSASESTQQQPQSQQQPQQNQHNQHNQHNKLPLPGLERMMQNLPRGQAQAPQAPVASRFDAPLVAPEAMAERIRIATTRDGGEARFAVDTPDGRQIEVELKVRNSTAELTLRGESDEMLRHMERTAKELTRALRDSGLQTGSVSVESQSPQTGQGRDGRKEAHNPSGHKATSGAPGEGREAGDGAPSAPRKNHDGLVYVVA
jgi:hypothetical protein